MRTGAGANEPNPEEFGLQKKCPNGAVFPISLPNNTAGLRESNQFHLSRLAIPRHRQDTAPSHGSPLILPHRMHRNDRSHRAYFTG
jgi:hypothetical protein